MRPPKSVRDRLKAAGEWTRNDTPPPEVDFHVDDLGTNPTPVPGAYAPVFSSFQAIEELPSIEISIEDPFYEYSEMFDAILLENGINRRTAESMGISVPSLVRKMLSASAVGLAMHLSETHNVQRDLRGDIRYPPPMLPRVVSEYIQNTGAFTGPDGRLWKLSDCTSTVNSLLRCAAITHRTHNFDKAASEVWLPLQADDRMTSHVVACKLTRWFSHRGLFPTFKTLRDNVFSGDIPPDISALLSNMDAVDRSIVARCFTQYSTAQQFVDIFNDATGVQLLTALQLTWISPCVGDLAWGFNSSAVADVILSEWKILARRYQQAFDIAFSPATRVGLTGTKSQTMQFVGDGETWTGHSFYPLSSSAKTVAVTLGSPVQFQPLPQRNRTSGRACANMLLRSVVAESLGASDFD